MVKYHGLARRFLMPSGFLVRPLLNGGTLGRLQRLGISFSVRDRDRRFIGDRLSSTRSGLLAGGRAGLAGVRSGWPSTSSAFGVLQTVRLASSSATGLERETAPFPPARVMARLPRHRLSSCLSPRYRFRQRPSLQHGSLFARRRRDRFASRGLAGPPEQASLRMTLSSSQRRALLPSQQRSRSSPG